MDRGMVLLAREVARRNRVQPVARRHDGVVTATPGGGLVTVTVGGGTVQARHLTGYTPAVGDEVVCVSQGGSLVVLGALAPLV